MDNKKTRTRSTLWIALLALTLMGDSVAYGVPSASKGDASSEQHSTAAIYTGGPREVSEVEAFLDAFFAREDIQRKAGAAAISVVREGKVLVSKGYGITDQMSKSRVDASRSTFRIASVSKVFTAAAALQLVDQGKISLKDNIEKYLDGYRISNPFETPVTIEHLLTHTTGFEVREPSDGSYLMDPSVKPISLQKSIFDVFPPVVREPGTSYMYDNFATRLLGYIIEQVSGEPFGSYMTERLFKPLGMTSSSFSLTKELAGRLVTSYDAENNPLPFFDLSPREWPEGSMISTASDMALFMNALLNEGRAPDGTRILSQESVRAMSTYHVLIHPNVPDMTYGFESPVDLSHTNGEAVISKGGDILGFSSLLWLLPDRRTGVFVVYNTNQDLRNDLFAAFMDHYYADRQSTFGPKGYQKQSKFALSKLEGLYSDLRIKVFTKVEVTGDGAIRVSDVSGRHQLKQVDDLLFVDEEGKPLAFKEDADGQIAYMKYANLFSYAAKIPANQEGFPDVSPHHPYASYILGLKSLGLLEDDRTKPFLPDQVVTRGAFIHAFNAIWSLPESSNSPVFKDIANSPYRGDIQASVEAGLLQGAADEAFEPDRPIRREEAAAIVFRLLAGTGIRVPDATAALAPGTSAWAVDAVSSAVTWKLYGPEVASSDGMFDYGSQRALRKQEMAALFFTMLLPA